MVGLDIRSIDEERLTSVFESTVAAADSAATARGATIDVVEHQRQPPTPMDAGLVDRLSGVADRLGVPTMRMPSGAAHDTMLVAERIPSAMLFVPCKDGISHSPAEETRPADAAVAVRIALETILNQFDTDPSASPQ
jgi:acetylornithine deacetylase/succinyl-diaminopimelate desuccinylase-like protein